MLRATYLLPVLFFLNHQFAIAQPEGKRQVIEDRLLKWSDFQGNDVLDTFSARIYTDIDYDPRFKEPGDTIPIFKATCYIITDKSTVSKTFLFTRPDSIRKRVLNHEQQHYNLSRIGAAELNTLFRSFPFLHSRANEQADSLHAHIVRKVIKLQKAYDKETHHGRDSIQQIWWNKLTAESMKRGKLPSCLY